jgi:hypothetical protein
MPFVGPPPVMTTTTRDALVLAERQQGVIIFNSTTGTLQINVGSAASPNWADFDLLPDLTDELGYTEFTTNVVLTSQVSDLTIVSAPPIVFDGTTRVSVEFYCPDLDQAASIYLYLDGVQGGRILNGDSTKIGPTAGFRRLIPTAGSHTFSFRGRKNSATNATLQAGDGVAGNNVPGYIKVLRT